MPLNLLIVSSETPDQQDARRKHSGQASHETFAETLRKIDDTCQIDDVSCVDGRENISDSKLKTYDGIFFAGSPIQMYEDTPETRSAASFMTDVFASGVSSFGSCAGLQIAAVAAGGTTKPRENGIEAGFARGIVATEQGLGHKLLAGRTLSWDAVAMHSTVVDKLPAGAQVLAKAEGTPVEAAEIRFANGTFWGVQYHPEISLAEVADALRRQTDDLIQEGLVEDKGDVENYAKSLEMIDENPARRDIAWKLGVHNEVVEFSKRTRELYNFLKFIAE